MYQQEDSELIKRREIRFSELHAESDQASHAALVLGGVAGIEDVRELSCRCLEVTYDLRRVSLQAIENVLTELGFQLDNSLLSKLRRAFFHYTEETQRANLGYDYEIQATRDIFISRYEKLPHGCRDKRPPHWRDYL